MSILNKLKNLNTRKAARLLEVHPLAGESLELRLQYLAGVALATAIDREPNDAERMAFNALADSLQVDAVDAQEQLDERASVTEDDIALLFAAIRERDAGYLYLLDLAWIHAADGELEENEIAVTEELAGLLELDIQQVRNLHEFALLLKQRKVSELLTAVVQLPQSEALQDLLPVLLKPFCPFSRVLKGRWIDHGDGTATDTRSGLIWHRKPFGTIKLYKSPGQFSGFTMRLFVETSESISDKLIEIGMKENWRVPSPQELKEIEVSGKLPEEIFQEKINTTEIFTEKTQEKIDESDSYKRLEGYAFKILLCQKQGS